MNQTAKNNIHNNIVVRAATKRDGKAISQLIAELCRYEGVRNSTFNENDFARDGTGMDRAFSALVAEVEGKIIGFLTYYPGYDLPSATRGHHLGDFFVLEQFRRSGIGKALFSELARVTLARNFSWVSWTVLEKNDPALAFYKKLSAVLRNDVKFMAIGKIALGRVVG